MKKILFRISLLCFCISFIHAHAQKFEDLYALKWCKCADETFPDSTEVAKLLKEIGMNAGESDTYTFEKLEAYFKKNSEQHRNFGSQLEHLEKCVNQSNVDLSAFKSGDLEELTLQEKFPKNRRKLLKKFRGVNEALKADKSCHKGRTLFALWLYTMSNKQ